MNNPWKFVLLKLYWFSFLLLVEFLSVFCCCFGFVIMVFVGLVLMLVFHVLFVSFVLNCRFHFIMVFVLGCGDGFIGTWKLHDASHVYVCNPFFDMKWNCVGKWKDSPNWWTWLLIVCCWKKFQVLPLYSKLLKFYLIYF